MNNVLNIFLLALALLWCTMLTAQSNHLRGHIIELATDNATQAQRIMALEDSFDNYPFDHSKFETDINLIGSSVFPNWEMASDLYSKRGK
jgi:hypothetical protein